MTLNNEENGNDDDGIWLVLFYFIFLNFFFVSMKNELTFRMF